LRGLSPLGLKQLSRKNSVPLGESCLMGGAVVVVVVVRVAETGTGRRSVVHLPSAPRVQAATHPVQYLDRQRLHLCV
jgi:hypothetical protein